MRPDPTPLSLTRITAAVTLMLGCIAAPLAALAQDVPASNADEPLPLRLNARLSETYDDNLARGSSAGVITSDFITHADAGATFHRGYGQQVVDANVNLGRTLFRNHGSQDYSAVDWSLGADSLIGRDGEAGISLRQTKELMPLENFQSLVRDVVTSRVAAFRAHQDFGVFYRIELLASHAWYTNDNPTYAYNDNQANTLSLGAAWRPSQDTTVGIRVIGSSVNYAQPLTPAEVAAQVPPGAPVPVLTANFIANYDERQLAPWFTWTPSAGITVNGSVAEVNRSYQALSGQDVRSLFGTLGVDYDRKGRVSGGFAVHRELGGTTILASRLVETDGADLHSRYALDSLTRIDARWMVDRRRYSVDQPGYPAHREYENILTLAINHDLRHDISVGLEYTADWRRATPSAFAYTDRRLMAQLRYQP